MNMSSIISSIISQYGLYNITLPFKDQLTGDIVPTETVLHTIIKKTTIPMYSQYVPWIRVGDIPIRNLKPFDERHGTYYLPAFLTTTEVMYIIDISPAEVNTVGGFTHVAPAFGLGRSAQNVATAREAMMLSNMTKSEPTFEDLGHNKFRLYKFPCLDITIKVACCHEPNGETIEESCRESFMQLAILDIKEFLYNTLKYYNDLPSAFGNSKLNIEEFSNASSEKSQLLEKWDDTFHLDITDYIKFF